VARVGEGVIDGTSRAVDPIVKGLASVGVTADHLTWSALVTGLGAGVALALGWFGVGCVLATCSTLGDILDGHLARRTATESRRSELLDAVVDRYTEFAFLAGLVVFYRDTQPAVVLVLAAVLASCMISYASAKAEALQVAPPRGLMGRRERALYLVAGAGLSALLGSWLDARWSLPATAPELVGLAAVATIGNAVAVVRLVRIGRALR
jgi:CDP-diacylglycerol---glycerol-3-phosphate 3-phosphatidyltransferase